MSLMRDVREEQIVSMNIDEARKDWSRVDDAYEALKWRVSRLPSSGTRSHDDKFVLATASDRFQTDGLPRIVILYTFDDDAVTIENIKIESPSVLET